MDWLERLNGSERGYDLGGAHAEVLYWAHQAELPDNAPHRHTHFEVCLVGGHGAGRFRVQERELTLAPGVVFVARPGVIHQIVNTGSPCMELFWVSYQLGPSAGATTSGVARAFCDSELSLVADDGGRTAAAWRALRELAPVAGEASLRSLVAALLLTVAEVFGEPGPGPEASGRTGRSGAAQQALRYVHDNLDRPLGTEEVARQVGVSPRHLARLVRAHAGTSLHEYVLWARLHRAAHLLRRSDLGVKGIGAQVGYPDVHHFTRTFSRHIGCPPAAYRRGAGALPDGPIRQTPGMLV